MKTRTTVAAIASTALLAACSPEQAQLPEPAAPDPTPAAAPTAPPVGYACESGKTVSVQYPDAGTALVSYEDQTYTLRNVQAASGARYSGSGVEWWTASRDGQETATLSRLGPNEDVGVAILERCSRPSSGAPATPLPGPVQGGLTPSAPPCKGSQLRLSSEGGDAVAANRVAIVGVTNLGAQTCSLTGYPTVSLQDAQGRALTAVRVDQAPAGASRPGQPPPPVALPTQGKAFFDLAWNVVPDAGAGERTCPSAARVRVTAPGDTTALALTQSLAPCGGIRVSPFRQVAKPATATSAPAPSAKL